MARLKGSQFRFRKHDKVGFEGAEQDGEFLSDCFYDSGDLDRLRDPADPCCILLGRTGAGKTALLVKLGNAEENTVWLDPQCLSLQYLSNSTILTYLTDLGVDLDLFYRLLWRHIFTVELIKARFKLDSEQDKRTFLQRAYGIVFGDKRKQQAIDYLVEWGEHFWKDTEYRIREVTTKFESDVKSSLGMQAAAFEAGVGGGRHLSNEERHEIVHRAQAVVNSIQIRQLSDVIKLLAEDFLSEPQPRYYLVIDRLDEHWIEDSTRYRLIRALIETIQDFRKVRSAKIIIALRRDLIERVIRLTRNAGFQEEKYEPLYLKLTWTRAQLLDLLDQRINKLVRRRYTGGSVTRHDVLPDRADGRPIDEFLIERTMYRPRDIIVLFNCLIDQAIDRPQITQTLLRNAEAEYSRRRYRSLGDEWNADYPELLCFAEVLKKRPVTFHVRDLQDDQLVDKCLEVATTNKGEELWAWANDVVEEKMRLADLRVGLVRVFYRVGLVGLKTETFTSVTWSYAGRPEISRADIDENSIVHISPVFQRVLGARPDANA